jgi:23S rRNA (uridine2552-2'-O)-methyltransferase
MPKAYQPNDAWSKKAQAEGYRARSVYKLIELDERLRLLKPGMTVIDLGAAPGSWLQYVSKRIGEKGKAVGIDLAEIKPIGSNVITIEHDILDLEGLRKKFAGLGIDRADLVLSDSAPSTSGIRDIDQWQSIELALAAVSVGEAMLGIRGRCVIKVLRGADFDEAFCRWKRTWSKASIMRVKATRDRSNEVYVVLQK